MATYYVTFGQRYRQEPHPVLGEVSPDAWVEIEAPSYGRKSDTSIRAGVVDAV